VSRSIGRANQKGIKWSGSGLDPGKTDVRGQWSEVRFGYGKTASDPAAAGVLDPVGYRFFITQILHSLVQVRSTACEDRVLTERSRIDMLCAIVVICG
jgi:hypothetical protein